MITLIIAGFVIGTGYVVLCAAQPVHKCPRCKGRKVEPGGNGFARCRKCKGHGRTYRPGAARIHRMTWEHAAPWVRGRLRDAAQRLRDGAS